MLLQLHHQFADGVGVSNILPLSLPLKGGKDGH